MKTLLFNYKNYLYETSSKNTTDSYMSDLKKFLKHIKASFPIVLTRVNEEEITDYINLLRNQGMAHSSLSRTVAALRKFFQYCANEGVIEKELVINPEIPSSKRKLPDTISFDEVVKILEAPDVKTVKGMRDKAMLELMYATGARVSEIINLSVTDVSLKNEVVAINSGEKHRFVPMGKACINALFLYLKEGRQKIPEQEKSDKLFLNFYGEVLTRQGCWKIIKHYIEKVGIRGNVTAQTLRHSFALHLLNNGADVHSVSEMMGYSDVASAKIYLEVMNDNIKNVYRSAHPRA